MFYEMFAASALAQIIFGGKTDYSSEFNKLHLALNAIQDKQNVIHDDVKFIKARMCLENFSIKLFDNIELTIEHHTAEDIIAAAKEGFDQLLYIAQADDDNFVDARKKFNETYGDYTWVVTKYRDRLEQVDNIINAIENHTFCDNDKFTSAYTLIDNYTKLSNEFETTCELRYFKRKKLHKRMTKMKQQLFHSGIMIRYFVYHGEIDTIYRFSSDIMQYAFLTFILTTSIAGDLTPAKYDRLTHERNYLAKHIKF